MPKLDEPTAPTEGQRVLSTDVIRQIRERVYGLYDNPKLPNTPGETEVSRDEAGQESI